MPAATLRYGVMSALVLLACTLALAPVLSAGAASGKKDSAKEAAAAPPPEATDAASMRLQGEMRFRANCGRCHAAPQKFPPRMMATVLRHMRVRATITDQDMRLVLFYMTE
jgi:mono/diheme cytochrome c family protein